MFGRDPVATNRFDILIGKTARIQGDVDFTGGLHLDGRVTGSVRAVDTQHSTLSVSETGCIEGSVEVPNVVLNGIVKGDIRALGRVVLGAAAKVQGNVHYGVIETALGAEIQGRLVPLAAAAATAAPAPAAASAASAASGHSAASPAGKGAGSRL
ncbi:MAG TPA: polymer-forming cytoskeletal protein [Steroidobacteraceae bacterium]|nr:polymer-forming cytoskeletal protein [Steroidobacteraceae bacterium]